MDPDSARMLLLAITAVAVIVWLFGLRFLIVAYRTAKPGDGEDSSGTDLAHRSSKNGMSGNVEVEGQPGVLAARAASVLAKGSLLGPVKILKEGDDRILFERLGPGSVNQPAS